MKAKEIVTYLFYLVALANVLGVLFNVPVVIYTAKPLISITLFAMYNYSLTKLNRWYVYTLIACFLGDSLSLFEDNEILFVASLTAYFIAHLFLIKIILRRLFKIETKRILSNVIPFAVLLAFLFIVIKDNLSYLLVPAILYGILLSFFGTLALIGHDERRSKKSENMLAGAMVYIISDILLGVDKFYYNAAIFDILIVLTYLIGMYLIFRSMILRKKYMY